MLLGDERQGNKALERGFVGRAQAESLHVWFHQSRFLEPVAKKNSNHDSQGVELGQGANNVPRSVGESLHPGVVRVQNDMDGRKPPTTEHHVELLPPLAVGEDVTHRHRPPCRSRRGTRISGGGPDPEGPARLQATVGRPREAWRRVSPLGAPTAREAVAGPLALALAAILRLELVHVLRRERKVVGERPVENPGATRPRRVATARPKGRVTRQPRSWGSRRPTPPGGGGLGLGPLPGRPGGGHAANPSPLASRPLSRRR